MGFFDLFREDSEELSVEDMADYVYDIYQKIDKRCNYKADLSVLNPYERNLYVAVMLEIDVHNGGLGEILNSPVPRREREAYYNAVFEDSLDETLYNCEVELKEQADALTALYYEYIGNYESYFAEDL